MHYKHDIFLPGEQVNEINARLAADYDVAEDDERVFLQEHEFSTRWKMRVEVLGRRSTSLVLVASLYEPDGRQAGRELGIPGTLDQDYHFRMPAGDEYTLTLARGAYASLSDAMVEEFAKNATKCPHCAGGQLEHDSLRMSQDCCKITTAYLCLDCRAEFKATYTIDTLQTVKPPEYGQLDA